MLVFAVVCPHPPLLLPEVASGAAEELDDLRAACRGAIGDLVDVGLDRLVVVGRGAEVGARSAGGSLRRYGVDVHVGEPGDASLPLSLTIGTWLLEQAGCALPVEYVGLPDDAGRQPREDALTDVVAGAERIGVLAMADLSATLTESAPGYLDERAEAFDRSVVRALSDGDAATLRGLDLALAEELWCAGAPTLVALGAAVEAEAAGESTHRAAAGAAGPAVTEARTREGAAVTARVHYDAAPYGVGYVVAGWRIDRVGGDAAPAQMSSQPFSSPGRSPL